MSELVDYLKEICLVALGFKDDWIPIYPNDMPCNGLEGHYKYVNIKKGDIYLFIKYTIAFHYRCDSKGVSHHEEGVKYYVLHELRIDNLSQPIKIPEAINNHEICSGNDIVNDYGRFRYVFGDLDTAKSVVKHSLLTCIYPFLHVLSDDELEEWRAFLDCFERQVLLRDEKS